MQHRWLAALPALLVSASAFACPVCGGGGMNRQAYIDTAIFMSIVPLSMLAVFGYLAWRWSRADEPRRHSSPSAMSRLADRMMAVPQPPMNPANSEPAP